MKAAKFFGLLCTIFIVFKTCYGELTDIEDNSNNIKCENEKERLRVADQEIKIANLVNTIMTQNVKIANLESTINAQNAKIANLESTIMAQNAKITNPESTLMAQNVKIANLESTILAQSAKIKNPESTLMAQNVKIANLGSTINAQNAKIANLESTIMAQNAKIKNPESTLMAQNVKIANLESTIMAQNAKIKDPESIIMAQGVKIANLESTIMAQKTEFEKLVNEVLERRIIQITSDFRFQERLQQEIEHRRHLNGSQNALFKKVKALETIYNTSMDELKGTQMGIQGRMEMCFEKQSVLESDLQKIVNETVELGMRLHEEQENSRLMRTLKRRDCQDVLREGNSVSGVYNISTVGLVYCDMDTDGGGWTVFQHRYEGSVNFYRTWADYKTGFGNLHKEFWLGNDNIHKISEQGKYKLQIQMEDFSGNKRYAEYSTFSVANENNKYRLNIGSYRGTAGDSLSYHNNMMFSTKDRDNDKNGSSCSKAYKGGWWYNTCYISNLNGPYKNSKTTDDPYNRWTNCPGGRTNMKTTTMMMRKI